MLAMLKMVNFTASVLFNIPSCEGWNEAMVRTWLYHCIPFGCRGPCDWLWPMRSLDHIWSRGLGEATVEVSHPSKVKIRQLQLRASTTSPLHQTTALHCATGKSGRERTGSNN